MSSLRLYRHIRAGSPLLFGMPSKVAMWFYPPAVVGTFGILKIVSVWASWTVIVILAAILIAFFGGLYMVIMKLVKEHGIHFLKKESHARFVSFWYVRRRNVDVIEKTKKKKVK